MRHFLIKPQMQSFPGVAQELPSCICNIQTHGNGNTASLCLVFGREFTDPPSPGVPASRVLLIQEHPLVMASPWWRLSSGGPHHLVGGPAVLCTSPFPETPALGPAPFLRSGSQLNVSDVVNVAVARCS